MAAFAACLFLAAPASAVPVHGLGWVSFCTSHGIMLQPVRNDDDGNPSQPFSACHSVCTLPRKAKPR
ncbi:MAG: hypothetical protein ACM3YM_02160 [Sphingomonadales bacterium]